MLSLTSIENKLKIGERITPEEGLFLFYEAPLEWLEEYAQLERKRRTGDLCFYNRNLHFEPTNKCIYSCKFCAFYRTPKSDESQGAWEYTLQDLEEQLKKYPVGELTELHITGGVHPDRGVEWAEELIQTIRKWRPEIHIKAFTAVEITFFSQRSQISLTETLQRLMDSGLDSLPGGGAEIFNPEIRKKIAGGKAPAHTWLEVHHTAHQLGLSSNATMLYGHIESFEDRIDHLNQLRKLQDKTFGFKSFIPLRYRNQNNALSNLPEVSSDDDMRNFAVSRLFLDNIPHLKAYWVMLGIEDALRSLDYGVDDLDGTVDDSTKIYSMAGSMEHPKLHSTQLQNLIRGKNRVPVERDSKYHPLVTR